MSRTPEEIHDPDHEIRLSRVAAIDVAKASGKVRSARSWGLLSPLDVAGYVVTVDAMQTQCKHARWLREQQKAHFVFPVLDNQPTPFDCLDVLDWASVPVTAWSVDDDRGRHELRTIQVRPARGSARLCPPALVN